MTAEDELPLPQVPEARPEDPEDVSWSLSTAEAMWARGDHLEGIKWVRKAAEAASEVEDDQRALDLAKAASELATIIARRSRASVAENVATAAPPPPDASFADTSSSVPVSVQPLSGQPVSAMPTTTRSQMPAPPPTPVSLPPAPLSPMPQRPSTQPTSRPMSQPPPRAPLTSRPANEPRRPLSGPPRGSAAPASPFASASKPPKPRRKSRDNLDAEAGVAGAITDTAPHPAVDGAQAASVLGGANADRASDRDLDATAVGISPFTGRPAASSARPKRRSGRPVSEPEATVIARLEDLEVQREKSASPQPVDWDRSPTRSTSAAELDLPPRPLSAPPPRRQAEAAPRTFELDDSDSTDRQTAFVGSPIATAAPIHAPMRSVQPAVHDPAIQTTQAVRVVVWRDANGVHVAPAGTVVSAITIDAVLVVLDEGADLTAWLSQRER